MKTQSMLLGVVVWLLVAAMEVRAQVPIGKPVHYELVSGNWLTEDCYPCGPPVVLRPMKGSFELVLVEETPISARYEFRSIQFEAGTESDPRWVTGTGTLEIGGEVALRQTVVLNVEVNGRAMVLTNESAGVERPWPMVAFAALETPAELFFVRLDVAAAPLREVWFTTAHGMTPGRPIPGFAHVGPGELLAEGGRVVRSSTRLFAALDLESPPKSGDVDACWVGAGGVVFFSLAEDVTSTRLGRLQEGDLVTSAGEVAAVNQALLSEFGLQPPVPDLGLDAWLRLADGTEVFSLRTDGFSERLGRRLGHGDLLTGGGAVYRGNRDLLGRFEPVDPELDYGLDGVYVWPSGEVWFTTSASFESRRLGTVGHGDLLSDFGYVVRRNLEMVAGFSPLEDLADFGLDGFFVVTDWVTEGRVPKVLRVSPLSGVPGVHVSWEGQGVAFQLERARQPQGPYLPVSPLTPDLGWNDTEATPFTAAGFYRVRQW